MSIKATRTAQFMALSTANTVGIPHVPAQDTTINQHFGVAENESLKVGEVPYARYLAVGRKGVIADTTTDGKPFFNPVDQSPVHAGLYEYIPWAIRPLDDDFPEAVRSRYRMRVPIIIDGVNYIAYYLLALPYTDAKVKLEVRHTEDGKITSTPFTPDPADLTPKQIKISNVNVVNPSGDAIVATCTIGTRLTQEDINELIRAFILLDGKPDFAILSEFAMVTAVDRKVTGTIGGQRGTYIEAIGAQTAAYFTQVEALNFSRGFIDIKVDIGSSEPVKI